MEKPDFVIDLVRSLSKSEKRYFKLFAARYKPAEEKNYLRLFSAFEKMRTNDPGELAVRLEECEYSGTLAADKHYLWEMLVSSLRQFRAGATVQERLANELLTVELLRRKGLFSHALRRLLRVKKEAVACEQAVIVVQAIGMECEIRAAASLRWPELSATLAEEKENWLCRMIHLNRIEQARIDQLRDSIERGRPQSDEERAAWQHRLAQCDPEQSVTGLVTEKSIRLRTHSHAYFVMQDVFSADRVNAEQHALFRGHAWLAENSLVDYLAFLFRYISTSIQLKNFDRAESLLAEVRAIRRREASYSEAAVFIDERLLSTELFLFGKSGRYDRMREKAPEAEDFIRDVFTRQRSVISFNMSIAFLLAGDYRKVLHWTYRALLSPECKKDYMLFLGCTLHQLIAHIGMNDFDAALSRAGAARRFVEQRNDKNRSDRGLIALLGKCAATDDGRERAALAAEFLSLHGDAPAFAGTDEFVAIAAWLRSTAGNNVPSTAKTST